MKPSTGVFYIWWDKIIYSLDTKTAAAPDHVFFFRQMIDHVLPKLDPETRRQIHEISPYALERGRVTSPKCQRDPFTGDINRGTLTLFGTPGCKPLDGQLKELFGLTGAGRGNFVVNTCYDDAHYRRIEDGSWLMQEVSKENRVTLERQPEVVRLPGVPRRVPIVQIDDLPGKLITLPIKRRS